MSEFLTSGKLNKSARNQLFLYAKKARARFHLRDASSRETFGFTEQNLAIFADYRRVSTNNGDVDATKFEKSVRFPENMFASGIMPVVLCSLQYQGDAVHKTLPTVEHANSNRTNIRIETQGPLFNTDQDYWMNVIAISPTTTTTDENTFLPVDWGEDDEDLKVSSRALNQMAENDDFLNHNRVMGTLSNVDYVTKEQDYYIRYLNNHLLLYGKYHEFNPMNDTFNKSDDSRDGVPKKFIMNFEFPDNLFKRTAHPVVVANVGAKVAANNDNSEAIRKLTYILKEVRKGSFSIEIRELSNTQAFSTRDTYFISYIVIGEKAGDDA
jgi:hypothetical protein